MLVELRVVDQRVSAVHEVLDGATVVGVAARYGVVAVRLRGATSLVTTRPRAQLVDEVPRSPSPFRIAVFVLPVVFGAFTWKLCRDLERHRHAARVAATAEAPVALNEPLEDGVSSDGLAPSPRLRL